MRRQDIPFAVTRDRNYYQRREVIEAAGWVRAIINPTDHLALLTALRSIVVGVPDAALLPLWAASFPRLVTELGGPRDEGLEALHQTVRTAAAELPAGIPGIERLAGWPESLMAALGSLRRLRIAYRTEPGDVFVRALRSELLTEVSESARFQGKFRLANLHRFFRQLESALESDESDVHSILRALRLGVSQAREAEEAMPRDAAEQAVQVMTIHTAKGLEFDHVYVPQLHARTRSGGDELVEATEVEPGRWQYHLFGAHTLGYQEAEQRRALIEAAEMVRTLYVAMTRASRRLVLIGRWPETPEPEDPVEAADYIDLLQHRRELPASLAAPANEPQTQLAGHWDAGGIRWRFLGGTHKHRAPRALPDAADWLPTAERLAWWATGHAERSAAARARMERPWTATATAEVSARLESEAAFAREIAELPAAVLRARALDAGSLVHHCLESWRFEDDPAGELDRQRRRLSALVGADPLLRERVEEMLERFAAGSLVRRLTQLASHVVGREIPLLAAPAQGDGGPVACYSGAIDLLYRDPATGEMVVADFKTDRLEGTDELAARAEAYWSQEELYARAVQEASASDSPPRRELWFLWADVVITLPGSLSWPARSSREETP
jgi:ATP-dependent exoDNAse (exonuclease V) beta subunit